MVPPNIQAVEINGHHVSLNRLHDALTEWGSENFRSFPWRETEDPYRLLVAEMMLIRTRADQVEPVYREFLDAYSTLEEATQATRDDVHHYLDVLGLTWRADRVHEALMKIERDFHGSVPHSKDDLQSLPGVSQYVASAVRCFAWGIPEPLIDANTVRISGRLFGLEVDSHSRETRQFRQLIEELLDKSEPKTYNYALLDLGAQICTSRSPNCEICPLLSQCRHGRAQLSSKTYDSDCS